MADAEDLKSFGSNTVRVQFPPPLPFRIVNKISVESNGCWIWKGAFDRGYGYTKYNKRKVGVHRLVAYICIGGFDLLNSKVEICHTDICQNRRCCNPEHIYIGNRSSNMQDAIRNKTFNRCKK